MSRSTSHPLSRARRRNGPPDQHLSTPLPHHQRYTTACRSNTTRQHYFGSCSTTRRSYFCRLQPRPTTLLLPLAAPPDGTTSVACSTTRQHYFCRLQHQPQLSFTQQPSRVFFASRMGEHCHGSNFNLGSSLSCSNHVLNINPGSSLYYSDTVPALRFLSGFLIRMRTSPRDYVTPLQPQRSELCKCLQKGISAPTRNLVLCRQIWATIPFRQYPVGRLYLH